MDTRRVIHGPVYSVPSGFAARFLAEFPDYRIRWSLRRAAWQIEQRCGRGALPPFRIAEEDDTLIRARDGYWLVMEIQAGDRMPCKGLVDAHTNQRCGLTLSVPTRKTAEVVCQACKRKGRDGRQMACYWPLDECLLEYLRLGDPLRGGTSRLKRLSDQANHARMAAADRKASNEVQAATIDAYDTLVGITHNTTKSSKFIHSSQGLT